MNSTSKILLAVVGAAAAGAIIGMLVAPEKGSELRRKLTDGAEDLSNQLAQLLTSGKCQLESLKDSAVEKAGALASDAEHRYNKVKDRVS